jgi:hypothetical protein
MSVAPDQAGAILQSLLQVGVNLSAIGDRQQMLDMILTEARKLAHAQAGQLYIMENGSLNLVCSQNDKVRPARPKGCSAAGSRSSRSFQESAIPGDCLACFVASSGRTINLPDSFNLSSGVPFRIDRSADAASGYRSVSILAIPLKRTTDGKCIGVLELVNRTHSPAGSPVPFPSDDCSAITSLAAMAAVTIHNALLQEQIKQAHLDTIIRLSVAAEYRDDDTTQHIHRVSHTSAMIARGMGLSAPMVDLIQCASPMHDIGKIGVPDAILRKCGPLSQEQREVVQQHTVIGGRILAQAPNELLAIAHDIAMWHHERWDGEGYPDKLAGERIPLAARIVGLADVFDALVTRRCYKEPYALDVALGIIHRENGKHFDTKVTNAFFLVLEQVLACYRAMGVIPGAAAS